MTIQDYEAKYLTALGEMILAYNKAELALKRLLESALISGKPSLQSIMLSKIMTVELGNLGASEALQSYAQDVAPREISDRIVYAAKYLDIIRGYRNFYIHGIAGIINTDTGPKGWIHLDSARARLKEHKALISLTDITDAKNHCETANCYFNHVINRLSYLLGDWPAPLPPPPLPDKPNLPKPIQKPSRYWREYFPPDEALPE